MEGRKLISIKLTDDKWTPLSINMITDDKIRLSNELESGTDRAQILKQNSTRPTSWNLIRTAQTKEGTVMEYRASGIRIIMLEWDIQSPTRCARAKEFYK